MDIRKQKQKQNPTYQKLCRFPQLLDFIMGVGQDLVWVLQWIYKIKTQANVLVECYKVCLVAKDFTQEYGIDFEETFAPIARLTSVRSLLAVAIVQSRQLF